MERSATGDLVPATGVDDVTLQRYAQMAEEENIILREKHRQVKRGIQREMRLAELRKRKMTRAASKVERQLAAAA